MALVRKNWKEQSRIDWGQDLGEHEFPGREAIQLGAILRIADAMEAMAKSHTGLVEEKERYRKWYIDEREQKHRQYRMVSRLHGVITRLKKNKGKYHVKH